MFGTRLIEMLQSMFAPELNWFFLAITMLGNDVVLVGLSAAVYWCIDKRRGRLVTYILLISAYLNYFLKVLVPWPRPPVDLRIAERNETSYGFPSGHAQDSTTFWTWIALNFRKRILTILGAMVVVAVGISRVYLGLHYLAQVIGGWVIGLVVAGLAFLALRRISQRNGGIRGMPQLIFAVSTLAPLAIAVALNVAEVNAAQIGGYLFGFSVGALAEDRYVHFTIATGLGLKIVRLAMGGALTGALVLALGAILPEKYLISVFANSVIRGLFVAVIVPALFVIIERRSTQRAPD
jgi:membrane-associated phospholipid phosphatase